MPRLSEVTPKFVREMPKEKESGILYISKEYGLAIHLCACGCGEQTVTPIGMVGVYNWTLIEKGDKVSLSPSILNSGLPCKAHYYIKNNKIKWCGGKG